MSPKKSVPERVGMKWCGSSQCLRRSVFSHHIGQFHASSRMLYHFSPSKEMPPALPNGPLFPRHHRTCLFRRWVMAPIPDLVATKLQIPHSRSPLEIPSLETFSLKQDGKSRNVPLEKQFPVWNGQWITVVQVSVSFNHFEPLPFGDDAHWSPSPSFHVCFWFFWGSQPFDPSSLHNSQPPFPRGGLCPKKKLFWPRSVWTCWLRDAIHMTIWLGSGEKWGKTGSLYVFKICVVSFLWGSSHPPSPAPPQHIRLRRIEGTRKKAPL